MTVGSQSSLYKFPIRFIKVYENGQVAWKEDKQEDKLSHKGWWQCQKMNSEI